jgi:hypothetical protein
VLDNLYEFYYPYMAVEAMRKVVKPGYRMRGRGPEKVMDEWVKRTAETAAIFECGNCGERASVAYRYLYQLGVRPLDYMAKIHGDHAFVVIGRVAKSGTKPIDWGPEAVVCDPWFDKAFRATEAPATIRVHLASSQLRAD